MSERSGFRVQQIDHVELFVPGRHDAAAWYRRVLGLEIVAGHEHWAFDPRGPLMVSSDGGSTKLALFRGTPQGQRQTAGYHLVAFRVDGPAFLAFLERVESLGLADHRGNPVTAQSAVDHQGAYSVYFNDPWGHRLEITSYDYDWLVAKLQEAER